MTDRTQFVIGVAGGLLQTQNAAAIVLEATQAFKYASAISSLPTAGPAGTFHSLSAGVRYDGKCALNLNTKDFRDALTLDYLLHHVAIARLAAFANGIFFSLLYLNSDPYRSAELFAAFAPACFRLAGSLVDSLFADDPTLKRPFPGAWTNVTFALGPQSVTHALWISSSIRWCWISITALGSFDPQRGGHLILWDLGRLLEFPPGTTILIPSLLRFSIARIQPGETRYSITQYAAAPDSWSRWPAATVLFSKLHDISSLPS
ncbi:hypothetical protein B0H13DRAFT_1898644 [Mycena leptocephala]|nr:hypothetical protein B0H13DRAFT_1898644 [Mycena leptocephala]